MDPDDAPRRPGDPLVLLVAQDLDRLGVAELHRRIETLSAEIERTRARIAGAAGHRADADALFGRR